MFLCILLSVLSIPCFAGISRQGRYPHAITTIEVPPGEGRPFIISNGNGAYFYGSTSEYAWDSGWMGLWVNRRREAEKLQLRDGSGKEMVLREAACRIEPNGALWFWPGGQEQWLHILFTGVDDTLHWCASEGLHLQEHPLIRPLDFITYIEASNLALARLTRGVGSDFTCADTSFVRAVDWIEWQLRWLHADSDSLLYAGIPWFNEGWGRDTFISLPGLLVTGHTDAARKLLARFAGWIDRDPASPTYGRIPNRVRPGEEIVYNTADGTPWWVLGCYDYGRYSRDYDFWKPLLGDSGAITVAIEGALAKCDTSGFLMHGNADTWMDAVGPGGPHTPRGDRAVEIQALHHAALDAAIRMASAHSGSVARGTFNRWREARERIERNFFPAFVAPSQDRLHDHLNTDGSPDTLFRPNQLFALTVPLSPLVPPVARTRITQSVTGELVQRYGVLSLSSESTLFHPFHQDERYPKDNAYHNGTVWVWLSGPAKTALRQQGRADLALQLAQYEANLALTRGCAGSLPELLDAMPRKGKKAPEISGCVSQAWSLAEFLRTLHQDILGIRPVHVSNRIEPFWLIDPRIPKEWGRTTVRVTLEDTPLLLTMQNFGDSMVVDILPEKTPQAPLGIKTFDEHSGITGFLNEAKNVHLVYRHSKGIAYADGTPTAQVKLTGWPYDKGNTEIKLAPAIKQRKFATLAPPPWDVLTDREVFVLSKEGAVHRWKSIDPAGDDHGNGGYVYPLDTHFAPGILDIAEADIQEHRSRLSFRLTFRDLVQPGWHPEYGFQLTFAAIALHTPGGRRHDVAANSGSVLEQPASRIIFVGGGLRVEDDSGRTLAAFTPRSGDRHTLGSTESSTVFFELPRKYFPKDLSDASWTILVGAQDDHGGAGMGEFRTVKPVAERWAGGGNASNGPNVYDTLHIP